MSLQHAAQHLASKGRNGDSTLVHMTKGEVAGLQALAKHHGTSMTVNPHTGLPEAFSLKSLIPIAAGLMLGPAGFGIASSAMGAGLMVGGATALGTGSLKQGLIAGLGAYGGAGLGEGIGAAAEGGAGAGGAGAGTQTAVPEVVDAGSAIGTGPATTNAVAPQTQLAGTDLGSMNASGQYAVQPTSAAETGFTSTPADPSFARMTPDQYAAQSNTAEAGFGNTPFEPRPGVTSGNYAQQGLGTNNASSLAPESAANTAPTSTFDKIAANAEKNPKLVAMAAAPAIAEDMTPKPYQPEKANVDSDMGQRLGFESGYNNDIPGRTSRAKYTQISGEEAKRRYGFADGGNVASTGYEAGPYSGDQYSGYAPGQYSGSQYSGYDAPVDAGISAALPQSSMQSAPQGNPNQRIADLYAKVDAKKAAEDAQAAEEKRAADAAAAAVSDQYGFASGGGISTLGGYSDGGRLLRGPGDGVSDSIPATIGNKRPARLADGEFVVPARIVSEIGNGSTEAGARKLYAMMDRVQKARGNTVGKGKVAKNTRADKYLPA